MERFPTFVDGLDAALGGGLPRGGVILVAGTAGTYKTSLLFHLFYHNVKAGSKALFITLEEGAESLRASMEDVGMTGLDDLPLYILDVAKIRLEHKEEETQKDWIEILQKYISQRVKQNRFDLVAVDSLSALYALTQAPNPRRELFHLFAFLKNLDATTFLVSEMPHDASRLAPFDEDFLADGVLLLKQHELGDGEVQVRLRVVKMRRTHHPHGWLALARQKDRFSVKALKKSG
jgi:circadian clock protein KaiC